MKKWYAYLDTQKWETAYSQHFPPPSPLPLQTEPPPSLAWISATAFSLGSQALLLHLFSTNVNHFILLSVWKNHQLYQGKKQRLYLPWATNWACSTSWLPLRPHFLNANLADPQICPAHGISLCLPWVFSTQDPFPLDSQMACFIPPFSLCSPKLSILTSWNNWVPSHSLAPSLLYVSS